jgi:hypothetical protein
VAKPIHVTVNLRTADTFNESKVKRDHGKFASTGGGSGGSVAKRTKAARRDVHMDVQSEISNLLGPTSSASSSYYYTDRGFSPTKGAHTKFHVQGATPGRARVVSDHFNRKGHDTEIEQHKDFRGIVTGHTVTISHHKHKDLSQVQRPR